MFLGIDIGSVSIKFALIDDDFKVIKEGYARTHGNVVLAAKNLLKQVENYEVIGIVTTGSGRKFMRSLVKADFDVDEITAHRTAIVQMYPKVSTIFEIGGQDSKLIYFNDKSVNFDMNNVCAAGTGSFLDQQASRLGMSIEEFCKHGLGSKEAHKIASKCTVFAESDMIHAQQSGVPTDQIIRGVHRGLVNNYFSQLCRGKKLRGEFLFEGGTSENPILVQELAFRLLRENLIQSPDQLIVPRPYNKVIGAIGVANLCISRKINNPRLAPQITDFEFLESGECYACPNKCGAKITKIRINGEILTLGKSCQN